MDTVQTPNAIFLIEGGPALQLVRDYISDRGRVNTVVAGLAKKLGISRATTDHRTGVLQGVVFDGEIHPDFRKPDRRGVSYPRKGSPWAKRVKEQVGHADQSRLIAQTFGIPLSIGYTGRSAGGEEYEGWRRIGSPLTECGFLWMTHDGPFAMWTPDVPAIVAAARANNETVAEPAASFKLEFAGWRRIRCEEWEIMVLQHRLQKAA